MIDWDKLDASHRRPGRPSGPRPALSVHAVQHDGNRRPVEAPDGEIRPHVLPQGLRPLVRRRGDGGRRVLRGQGRSDWPCGWLRRRRPREWRNLKKERPKTELVTFFSVLTHQVSLLSVFPTTFSCPFPTREWNKRNDVFKLHINWLCFTEGITILEPHVIKKNRCLH